MTYDEQLRDFLDRSLAVAIAELDGKGRLRWSNAGFLRLLPLAPPEIPGALMEPWLINPLLDELVAAPQKRPGELVFRGMLTIGHRGGRQQTISAAVYRTDGGLRLFAGLDAEEMEQVALAAIRLALDLAASHCKLQQAMKALEEREERIRQLTYVDPLAGPGRKLAETLAGEAARAKRYGTALSLVLSDIDQFGEIIRGGGARAGDQVIKAVADALRASARKSDLVARYSAEEFAVLMPQTPTERAVQWAERARQALGACVIPPLGQPLTASFGVAELGHDADALRLLHDAATALEAARQAGRNRVVQSL
jgi:diguanylate cyclase (GGDEF)-like protein